MSIAVSVRLPEKLAAELSEVARISERSKSFLIQKALEVYLDDQADSLEVSLRGYSTVTHRGAGKELQKLSTVPSYL